MNRGEVNGERTADPTEAPVDQNVIETVEDDSSQTAVGGESGGSGAVESFNDYRDSRGRFVKGNPGGPGYRKIANRSMAEEAKRKGKGAVLPSLAEMLDECIRDPSYLRRLKRISPATIAQMRMAIAKEDKKADAEPVEKINLILGDLAWDEGLRQTADMPPGDMSVEALRAEVARLRRENQALLDAANKAPTRSSPKAYIPKPEVPGDPVECIVCKRLGGVPGRMIAPMDTCKFCGSLWEDARQGIETKPVPDRTKHSSNAACIQIDRDSDGWVVADDLSSAILASALGIKKE